ncbi:MAG: hypothetical protein ACMXYF_03050 [Candidatus Woesearchaeota archaeon]
MNNKLLIGIVFLVTCFSLAFALTATHNFDEIYVEWNETANVTLISALNYFHLYLNDESPSQPPAVTPSGNRFHTGDKIFVNIAGEDMDLNRAMQVLKDAKQGISLDSSDNGDTLLFRLDETIQGPCDSTAKSNFGSTRRGDVCHNEGQENIYGVVQDCVISNLDPFACLDLTTYEECRQFEGCLWETGGPCQPKPELTYFDGTRLITYTEVCS